MKNSPIRKKTVAIIDWLALPKVLQDKVADMERFGNDRHLKFYSEFAPKEISRGAVEEYFRDQIETNDYTGNFDDFVKDYGLEVEMWIIDQEVDLSDVSEILIKVCW